MPKKMEKELRKAAKKKGLDKENSEAYIYGTLRKTGWKPKGRGRAKTAKRGK